MPSLGDTANDILNVLNHIQTNTDATSQSAVQIKGDTADLKVKLDQINGTLIGGFSLLAGGLFGILEQQKETNSLLIAEIEQDRTIICWLTNIAEVLCKILHQTDEEVVLQRRIEYSVNFLKQILELVHSRETVEVQRLRHLEDELHECCKEKPNPPEPCFEPCPSPKINIYQPQGGDWHPPKRDQIN